MFKAYTPHTPSGRKLAIMLRETGLAHRARRLDVAGAYSIADIALLPWIQAVQKRDIALDDFAHLDRWYAHLTERAAVRRGFEVPTSPRPRDTPTSGERA